MDNLVMFSGGIGSWATAKRVERPVMLFADTLMEDTDLYRFVSEAAANVAGVNDDEIRQLTKYARLIPAIESSSSRKQRIDAILWWQHWAQNVIPGFMVVCDGRTPWEVYEKERFIGNSRLDPCSKILKRELLDKWRDANCDPDNTTIFVGIDWTEQHRLVRIRERCFPWKYEAPLCQPPLKLKREFLAELRADGIEPPALYGMGFAHNNCGGFCCKAGQAHFALLYSTMPERYAWHEAQEERLRADGINGTILTSRVGDNKKKPLALREFRESLDADTISDLANAARKGGIFSDGCGCALQ
jgi:hypothetical protein